MTESALERTPLLGPSSTRGDQTQVQDDSAHEQTVNSPARPTDVLVEPTRQQLITVFVATWSAVFFGSMDLTIVAALVSPIGSYFDASHQASYLGTAYLLSVCCFTPLYGRLADILGRKGALLLALSLFALGTLLCGLANSMNTLIAARAIAGMGGGGILTVSSVIMSDLVPPRKRGVIQGLYNVVFGLGSAIGGPVGGFLSDSVGWRWAFLFQVPFLLVSFALCLAKLNMSYKPKESSLREKLARIDWLGTITLVSAVASLLVAVTLKTAEEMPWSAPLVWGLFSVSIASSIGFVLAEGRWSTEPIMPLGLLGDRTVLAVCLSNFFISAMAYSMFYNVPIYFMAVRLQSAGEAGAHLMPNSIFVSVGSLAAGWYIRSSGKYWLLIVLSGIIVTLGNMRMAMWSSSTTDFELWAGIIPIGLTLSSLVTSTLVALVSSVPRERLAVATGTNYLFRTTGQVLGVSFAGAIAQSILREQLEARIRVPGAEELIREIRHSTNIIRTLEPELRAEAIASWALALRAVFIFDAANAFLSLLACMMIPNTAIPESPKAAKSVPQDSETAEANGPSSSR